MLSFEVRKAGGESEVRKVHRDVIHIGASTGNDLVVRARGVLGRHARISVSGEELRLDVDGHDVLASVIDERAMRASRGAAASRSGRVELRAPMPGLLKAVHVKEGDIVERDAPIVTLEAMKMENELLAPIRGRVAKLNHTAGAKLEGGVVVAVLIAE